MLRRKRPAAADSEAMLADSERRLVEAVILRLDVEGDMKRVRKERQTNQFADIIRRALK